MSSKSRNARGKRSSRSKKRKGGQRFSTAVNPQQAVTETPKPTPQPSTPIPKVKLVAAQYPYIVKELRTIGILAGIMLTILVVLYLTLS